VRVVVGSKLDPRKSSVFCLLSRSDMRHEVSPGKEPTMMEDVEDVEHRKFNNPRRSPTRLGPPFGLGEGIWATGGAPREGEKMSSEEDMVVKEQEGMSLPHGHLCFLAAAGLAGVVG
jgi:hypothetical protein